MHEKAEEIEEGETPAVGIGTVPRLQAHFTIISMRHIKVLYHAGNKLAKLTPVPSSLMRVCFVIVSAVLGSPGVQVCGVIQDNALCTP